MRSRLLLASLAVALVSVVVITVAAALQWWTLAAAVAAVLLGGALILAADADRQARMVRRRLAKMSSQGESVRTGGAVTGVPFGTGEKEGVRDVPTPALGGPDVETSSDTGRADMLGAVRVLQAQYTARLDRLQASVEEAMTDLRSQKENGADTGPR